MVLDVVKDRIQIKQKGFVIMPRRGTNIYKRKDGRWEARYVTSIGIDGKKKYASVYAATYREAKEKQFQSMKDVHISSVNGVNSSLEEIMWAWLSTTVNSVKQSTFQKYESMIRNHIVGGMGQLQLRYISSLIIDQFAHEKLQHGLSPKTVNDILSILGLAMNFAEQEYGYTKPRIRRVKEERKEMRVLSFDEQKVLEKHLLRDLDLYKLGVLLTLYSGLRVGELCALQWDDIKDDRICINKSYRRIKVGSSTILDVSTPKTAASVRIIPIPSSVRCILEPFRSTGSVLKTRTGKQVEPRLMQLKFRKYISDCAMEKANFHALRHTFATRCIEAGFDVKTLSEILGHTDVKTTLNRYVHSSYELKESNMEKLRISV